jgi:hypothetical protein
LYSPAEADLSGPCPDVGGRHIPPRLAIASFSLDHPGDATDLDDLPSKLPHELAVRLSRSNTLRVRDAGREQIFPEASLTEPRLGEAGARQLGRLRDVQFVLAGRVLSTAVTDRSVHLSLFSSDKANNQPPAMDYTGPFSAVSGNHLKYHASARLFELEFSVYDGFSGQLLDTQHFSTLAEGDVWPKWPLPFASSAFWQGDYGRKVDRLLKQATGRVNVMLRCQPFASRVLRVEKDGVVYFAAGGVDGVHEGDRFRLYRQPDEQALTIPYGGSALHVPETLLGEVLVTTVQPNLSVAVVQGSNKIEAREGDVLRLIAQR